MGGKGHAQTMKPVFRKIELESLDVLLKFLRERIGVKRMSGLFSLKDIIIGIELIKGAVESEFIVVLESLACSL